MGRHAEDAGNLGRLELAHVEELRVARRDADVLPFQAGFQDGDIVLHLAGMGLAPAAPEVLAILVGLEPTGMLDDAHRAGVVAIEPRGIFVGGDGDAQDLGRLVDRIETDQAVGRHTADVQDLVLGQPHQPAVRRCRRVFVKDALVRQTPRPDTVRMQRNELVGEPLRTRHDARVSIAAQRQMPLHHLAELERCLPVVRAPAQHRRQRMVVGAFLAAARQPPVQDQRHRGQGLGQDLDTGEHDGDPHRGLGADARTGGVHAG